MSDTKKSSSSSVALVGLTVFLGLVGDHPRPSDCQFRADAYGGVTAREHRVGRQRVLLLYAAWLGVGAIVLGYFSDIFVGRKRAFMYGILGTVIMTGLTGFVQNAPELLVVRFLAGVFSGGEWAMGLAMLSEFAPTKRRSLLLAGTQAGVGVGYGLANVFAQTFASPTRSAGAGRTSGRSRSPRSPTWCGCGSASPRSGRG